jgi:C-terminal processing protease CtpA/Prc
MNSSRELAGIGVLVQRLGGLITVVDLVEGGPAHLSGQLRIGQVLYLCLSS